MWPSDDVDVVLRLAATGLPDRLISEVTGIPRPTVRDWRVGRNLRNPRAGAPCAHDVRDLPEEQYAYLLGAYLGDGSISLHPRGVWRLRVTCDTKYPGIVDAVRAAMDAVRGRPGASIQRLPSNCVDVSMYWKHWPCLIPQHGPGRKHDRKIELVSW